MDKDKLRARLLATFIEELDEHARTLETNALALEKEPREGRAEILKTLFRTAHSLKGASRSAGVPLIEATCHRLEELLSGARDGLVPLSAEHVQVLLATADALADAGRRLRAKESFANGPLATILTRIESVRPSSSPASSPPRAPSSPPVDAGRPSIGAEAAQDIVRLPAAKLDALVSRSGELLVARRRAARRQLDMSALRDTLSRCLAEWRRIEKPLRKLTTASIESNGSGRLNGAGKQPALSGRAATALARTSDYLKRMDRDLDRLAQGLASDEHMLAQAAAPLEEQVRQMSMLPFGDACEGLERAVRDLAKAGNKEIDLIVEGGNVELDRAILAALRDPLLHLVRNAVDHGIETPAERKINGKPTRGRITVAAALKAGGVEIVVADDGRGLDVAAIRERAHKLELAAPEDEKELVQLIFRSGFSTTRFITELSGRGVGLDVVKHRIESLHGSAGVSFEPGRGTRFSITLPLTLTTLRALLVGAAGQTFALPTAHVRRLVRAGESDLGSIEGREVLLSGGAPVPLAALAATLGLPDAVPLRVGGRFPLVVVAAGNGEVAFAVDELIAEQDVIIKNLGRRLRRVRHFAGATVLPTGRLALILAAGELVETAMGRAAERPIRRRLEEKAELEKKRLLVVDDSITTRSLEKSILEGAGYEVLTAADGAEAWQVLQEKGADLVVTDVEMPRLDGFGLTEAIRASKRFRDLPVILVTALETEQDKARGLEAGANAYLPKSAFDQKQLLQVIASLL